MVKKGRKPKKDKKDKKDKKPKKVQQKLTTGSVDNAQKAATHQKFINRGNSPQSTPKKDNIKSPVVPKATPVDEEPEGNLITIEEETIEEETESIKSDSTRKADTREYHFNDSDADNSWSDSVDKDNVLMEDEVNTVASNETSVIKKKDGKKMVLPKFTRYQMMILLDQTENDKFIEEINVDDQKSPVDRVREFLINFTAQMKKTDSDAKIISWKNEPNKKGIGATGSYL